MDKHSDRIDGGRRLTFASLFSGIGMADLAARWCGWEHKFWCEIDPFCRQVMAYHFKDSKNYGDITETYFGKWRGQIDVLHGSSPCQSVSAAGKQRGDTDDRWLWPHMLRAIREIRPKYISFENVANIATVVSSFPEAYVEGGYDQERGDIEFRKGLLYGIIDDIEKEGYNVQSYIIPACGVGAPHRRKRLWLVADSRDTGLQEEGPEQQAAGIAGDGVRRSAPDTESEGREGVRNGHEKREPGVEEQGQLDGGDSQDGDELPYDRWWGSFPTQPPVLCGDDGYPFGLAGCSIPVNKWRKESVKAVGNALVPQIIYEIYKAINDIENGKNR